MYEQIKYIAGELVGVVGGTVLFFAFFYLLALIIEPGSILDKVLQ